jgi:hypothetical protein
VSTSRTAIQGQSLVLSASAKQCGRGMSYPPPATESSQALPVAETGAAFGVASQISEAFARAVIVAAIAATTRAITRPVPPRCPWSLRMHGISAPLGTFPHRMFGHGNPDEAANTLPRQSDGPEG